MNMRVKRCIGGSILLLLVFLSVGLVWYRTGTAKRRTTNTVDSRASVTDYRYRSRESAYMHKITIYHAFALWT